MKIVIAPNAFKNSMTAKDVAIAIEDGLRDVGFAGEIVKQPVGDGGDGTGALLREYLKAETLYYSTLDPLLRKIDAPLGWLSATKTAIIEMSDASGLRLLKPYEYNPLIASTTGCGQLILAALNLGAKEILLCVGGSATVDAGAGILKELGLVFNGYNNTVLKNFPKEFLQLQSIDFSKFDQRIREVNIIILCDVKNRILGEYGAANIFAQQKGASQSQIELLNNSLAQFCKVVKQVKGVNIDDIEGGGAAGGIPAGLSAFCKVLIVDGITYFLKKVQFEKTLKGAGLVITGEGKIDMQTLNGKAPYGVACMAKKKRIAVVGVAGVVPEEPDEMFRTYFDELISINKRPSTLMQYINNTRENLVQTGRDIAKLIKTKYSV